jgi:Cu-Zn family superoxide dismutase
MNRLLCVAVASAALAACSTMTPTGPKATADLAPTNGNNARGTVTFVQQGDQVALTAKVSGLAPGAHGFHIHEKGDCSSGDGMSAGGHFNPTSKPHGDPAAGAEHHTGDMPMLQADASGNASVNVVLSGMAIGSGNDITDKAVIIHKDPDDYKTQPTGNSGARVACGVIRRA